MRNRSAGIGTALLFAAIVAAPVSTAATRSGQPARPRGGSSVLSLDNQRRIDVNRMNMFVTNFGSFAFDLSTGNGGLFFPKGTTKTAVFASGLWIGAEVNSQIRTVVAEYSQEYGPGPILPGGAPDDARKREHVLYKVNRFSGNPRDTAHVDRAEADLTADPTLDPLVHHSWSEYVKGAAPFGAPTRMYRFDNTLTPAVGDSVDIEGPDVIGDQMLWSVYNDADPDLHSNGAGNSAPFGLEIQQTTFGFNRTGALGSTVFLKFKIIHKGTDVMTNTFVSLWSDPDLGGFTDDLVGCDPPLSLGYVYNATNNDQLYGTSPPAVGYDFFQGPSLDVVAPIDSILPLASFNKYINGTDPGSPEDTYNYMQGLQVDGSPVIDEVTGDTTTFIHSGDPVTGTGWLDSSPADRRFMMSAGPFTLAPGDTQEVVAAIVIARGSDRLSSISGLRFFDVSAQDAFDRGFNLKSPPQQPVVAVDVDENRVRLCWDAQSRLNYNEPGFLFEGYNVYQGASIDGPWTLLGTFDEVNTIKVVRDTVFDINTGVLITDYPVAFGGDNGVAFCYEATTDAVRGLSLREGTEYFFAVTAYSVSTDPTSLDAVLENAITPIRIIPQSPALGTDPSAAQAACPQFIRANTLLLPTSDVIELNTVDAAAMTGHTYTITYEDLPAPVPVGSEIVTVGWNLTDETTGLVKLADQVNKSGDADYQVVDGLQVKVIGEHAAQPDLFNTAGYFGASCPVFASPSPPIEGVDFGGAFFGGGVAFANDFFGSTLDPAASPDSFVTIELRFDHTNVQNAYRYFRDENGAADGPGPRRYTYGGFHPVPFTVWDVENNLQLDAAFVERRITDATTGAPLGPQPSTQDATWGPDASDLGAREYLTIIKSGYRTTPDTAYAVDGALAAATMPLLYTLTCKLVDGSSQILDGDVFRFVWGFIPGSPNDTIRFQTQPVVRGDQTLAKAGLAGIRVVPNPYLARSRYEQNQFNRIMRFINMPEQATIRIYNLSGQLIRTLRKTDANSSFINWDLLTENGLPVASGVYVYHIHSDGVGETHGRLVVFMEKERLNNF